MEQNMSLTDLVPWVLERLINDEYALTRDANGQIKRIELDPDEYGDAPWQAREAGLQGGLRGEYHTALFSLKDGYAEENLVLAMTTLFGQKWGPLAAAELAEASWEEIIIFVDKLYSFVREGAGRWADDPPFGAMSDRLIAELKSEMAIAGATEELDFQEFETISSLDELNCLLDQVARARKMREIRAGTLSEKWEGLGPTLAKRREGFGSANEASMEQRLTANQPESMRMYLEQKYARELIRLFPKLVHRAEFGVKRMLRSEVKPPSDVLRCLNEAVRCYLYGQFLGALLLCRASVEAGIKDRLRAKEFGADVEDLESVCLSRLIDRARGKRLLDGDAQKWAHAVRELANDAAHPSARLPNEEDCKKVFPMARGVLECLYEPNPGMGSTAR